MMHDDSLMLQHGSLKLCACEYDVTPQYHSNPNPKHKKDTKYRLRNSNFNVQNLKTRKIMFFTAHTLGLGFLAGGTNPNQVGVSGCHGSSTYVLLS